MELIKYNNKYKSQLNTWQEKEKLQGASGLEDFVVLKGTLLGDYLEMIDSEMETVCLLALEGQDLVGFVCYEKKGGGEFHIEIMGTNPDKRCMGYSQKMLTLLKEQIQTEKDFSCLTLSVNVKNIAGQHAFDKVGTKVGLSENENYFEYEI